jgi:hypothetical protein
MREKKQPLEKGVERWISCNLPVAAAAILTSRRNVDCLLLVYKGLAEQGRKFVEGLHLVLEVDLDVLGGFAG